MLEKPIILHQGVYKPQASVAEAVFMITGMTIGAGILGIPYVVAKVGLWTGITYIAVLGVIMLYLNLMTGEVAVRTKQSFQLPGLAGHYLGNWARYFLSVVMVLGGTGALLAYTVGEGQILSALFGGEPLMWGTIFWAFGSVVVWRGLTALKNVDRILSLVVIAMIGLGQKFGPMVFWFSNLFAALSMGTGYIGLGIAIKQNLVWDNKVNPFLATLIVILIPICLFFAGISNFVAILDLVGAFMVGSSSIVMALVYVRARKSGDLPAGRYGLRYSWLAVAAVLAVFTIFTILTFGKMFF